jgi:hypothetical protein
MWKMGNVVLFSLNNSRCFSHACAAEKVMLCLMCCELKWHGDSDGANENVPPKAGHFHYDSK